MVCRNRNVVFFFSVTVWCPCVNMPLVHSIGRVAEVLVTDVSVFRAVEKLKNMFLKVVEVYPDGRTARKIYIKKDFLCSRPITTSIFAQKKLTLHFTD